MSNQEILKQYQLYIKNEPINTQSANLVVAELLSRDYDILTITKQELFNWFNSYSEDKSVSTKNQRTSMLRKLFTFLELFDYRNDNPSTILKSIKEKKDNSKTYELLTMNDYNAMFKDESIDYGLRVAIALTVFIGLRNSEVCNLKLSDVDFANSTIYIRDAKSGSAKVPMPQKLQVMIEDYIRVEKVVNGTLVLTKQRHAYTPDNFRKRYKVVLRKHNLPETFRVHDSRHFCASYLSNNASISINTVKEVLRHSSLSISQRYIHGDKSVHREQLNSVF